MRNDIPRTIYLAEYTEPDYWIDSVDLHFSLGDDVTVVKSRLSCRSNNSSGLPLILHGEELQLFSVCLDGKVLPQERYKVDADSLTILQPPDSFVLELETRIHPQSNTSLEGLYVSSDMYCTQCEAEGFRKITYYLDRPDVMATFSTTIEADKHSYPVLLSNGNLVDKGQLEHNRHWVTWQDPFKKPAYLFALVAGDLECLEDRYTTKSGRDVSLRVYVEHGNIDKTAHAMASLKNAMKWDEDTYGLEYDLDIYMIVAVGDFNMGAMENKGLNVFNTAYVLARPETATDNDYEGIEAVIGHEYFHNWTGNRVTCRDWFQLSLKEGLTVFRDQEFTADMTSPAVKRISDVRMLRARQFSEDAGPMAHPVRPDSYMEINNFYTVTVYEKGAEVVRMYQTLFGKTGFRKGLDLYFKRHDGAAVTTDDFADAMADANSADLTQFKRWYSQAGTPELSVTAYYDKQAQSYTLDIKQSCLPTPGQKDKKPFRIPLALGLLDVSGNDMPLQLQGEKPRSEQSRVFDITREQQSFTFVNVKQQPVPSLLRGFSAPVKLHIDLSDEQLAFLMANDSDAFNRWDASQQLIIRIMSRLVEDYKNGAALALDDVYIKAISATLNNKTLDKALVAQTLALPSESYLAELADHADPVAIHKVRIFVRSALANSLRTDFEAIYQTNQSNEPYRYHAEDMGRRALKNQCLSYLMVLEDAEIIDVCIEQYHHSNNMTDTLAAVSMIANSECDRRQQLLSDFYQKWKHDPLVVNKWFSVQAMSRLPGTIAAVTSLLQHPAFEIKNPNKVRAVIGAFSHSNHYHFHDESGAGYRFLADNVLILDSLNAQVASRMVSAFNRWRKYDAPRQQLIRGQLERILEKDGLSKDVQEIVSKSLV